jgi:hypothetical protein
MVILSCRKPKKQVRQRNFFTFPGFSFLTQKLAALSAIKTRQPLATKAFQAHSAHLKTL